jgi:hypothetical protein
MKLVILSLFVSIPANAARYEQFYLVNGSKSSAQEAILASLKGQEAFKCTAMEAKVSKAGTSIGMRQVKRPSSR